VFDLFFCNVQEISLSKSLRDELVLAHRQSKDKRMASRLNSILLLDEGYSFEEVSHILRIDDLTIREHHAKYKEGGIALLTAVLYERGLAYLSSDEIALLESHLESHCYIDSKVIIEYVWNRFGVWYSE
jgi:transposase